MRGVENGRSWDEKIWIGCHKRKGVGCCRAGVRQIEKRRNIGLQRKRGNRDMFGSGEMYEQTFRMVEIFLEKRKSKLRKNMAKKEQWNYVVEYSCAFRKVKCTQL